MKSFWIFLCIFCILTAKTQASLVERMECTGSLADGSKLEILLKQKDDRSNETGLSVQIELQSKEVLLGKIKSKEEFMVAKAENEALFEQVHKGLDFWLLDTKNGSSMKHQETQKRKRYQFEMKDPREGIRNIVVEWDGESLVPGNSGNHSSTAQVYVHRTPAAHADFLGTFTLNCKSH